MGLIMSNEQQVENLIKSTMENLKNMVDVNRQFRPSQYSKEEAKERFPEWYERVIVQGKKGVKKWDIKRDLYDWWLRQSYKVKGGHRYFYLMCMVIYAYKCNISIEEVKEDMNEKFEELKDIEHSNPLTKEDLYTALEVYHREYYNFTIDDIEKLTDIRIERNKRNYQSQKNHLEVARAIRDIKMKQQNKVWWNEKGRPKGSGIKENLVKEYLEENPDDNPTEIARNLGVSRTTVYKYL